VEPAAQKSLRHFLHKTIRRVTEDMERFHFNTMLAALMEFTNRLTEESEARAVDKATWQESLDTLLLFLAPTAPHLAEELWVRTDHPYSIHRQPWPTWDEELAKEESITLVIQVNGKLRDRVAVPAAIPEEEARKLALESEKVRAHIGHQNVRRVVYVPGRLVNIVL
jgi:leucyl-tRNA synthetase